MTRAKGQRRSVTHTNLPRSRHHHCQSIAMYGPKVTGSLQIRCYRPQKVVKKPDATKRKENIRAPNSIPSQRKCASKPPPHVQWSGDGNPAPAAQVHCNQTRVHPGGDSMSCHEVPARPGAPGFPAKCNARGDDTDKHGWRHQWRHVAAPIKMGGGISSGTRRHR